MIRRWLQRVMIGRYGPDQLNFAILIVAILLSLTASLTRLGLLSLLSYVLLFVCFFRMLSRKLAARRRENDRFLRYWWPVRTKLTNKTRQLKDSRQYKYFKCPGCHCTLRVPRKKGTIQITCRKCGERFIKKT